MRLIAQVDPAELDEFTTNVEADGGRVTRALEHGGVVHAEVEDLRHPEVLAAGAREAHPVEKDPAEFGGRKVRHLAPVRRARERRRLQLRRLHGQAFGAILRLRELELYRDHLRAGGDVK